MSKNSMVVRADNARRASVGRGQGQVVIMFALFLTVLLLLLGGGLDFAGITLENGRLQNAADSAALAAAQTLDDGGDKPSASATAMAFLSSNGYPASAPDTCAQNCVHIAYPTPSVGGVGNPQGTAQVADVSVGHSYQTSFWGLIGLPTVNLQADAQASSSGRRFDVFLSIDETSSMNDDDMIQLRRAARLFVRTLNPTAGDQYSPKVAMSIFEGLRYGAAYTDMNGQYTQSALRESVILSHLTNNARDLYTLIDGAPDGSCGGLTLPGGSTGQPPMPYAAYPPLTEQARYTDLELWQLTQAPAYQPAPPLLTDFACKLKSDHRGVNRTFVGDGITAAFARNVLSPFNTPPGSSNWDAFDYLHGGRDGTHDGKPAKRILVEMTDGTSNIVPISPRGPGDCATSFDGCTSGMQRWEVGTNDPSAEPDHTTRQIEDQTAIDVANVARSGPDGLPGTDDDIEIYMIGFFGENESALTSNGQPLCPAAVMSQDLQTRIANSRADRVMLAMSSSSPGSCDHYFPVAKSSGQQTDQGLPTIFSSIAGRIKRAQLVN